MIKKRLFKLACGLLIALVVWTAALAPLAAQLLIVEKPLESADAIFVLAGSSSYRERVAKAAEVYKRGVAARVVLTDDGKRAGWSRAEQRNPSFVELAKNELIKNEIPAENIEILPPVVNGTIDEARVLRDALPTKNWKSVLIVTSDYHTRRALRAFEKVLSDSNVEVGIEYARTNDADFPRIFWWLSARGRQTVIGEYAKTIYYWFY